MTKTSLPNKYQCAVCRKSPLDLPEYVLAASSWNESLNEDESIGAPISETDYVIDHEGTFNKKNNLFVCTNCYLKVGCPSNDINDPKGAWKPSGFAYYIGKGKYQFELKREDGEINES